MSINMNVNIQPIKEGMSKAYHLIGDWLGRSIEIIKSNASMQDKRVAVVSLVALNMILVHLGAIFISKMMEKIEKRYPKFYSEKEDYISISGLIALVAIVVGGVSLFAKTNNLPFNKLTILAISVLSSGVTFKRFVDNN